MTKGWDSGGGLTSDVCCTALSASPTSLATSGNAAWTTHFTTVHFTPFAITSLSKPLLLWLHTTSVFMTPISSDSRTLS
eukprot:1622360-Pyramimonas_sp.AAC.1